MESRVKWLRVSYWAGAIGDFAVAILVLFPERMGVPSYVYPMGLMSAVSFSWGCMLIWADREPIERRWVLLPTILVGTMLLLAGIYSIYVGAITARSYIPNFILLPAMITLWSFSYYRARAIES
jgi:drug/metabolite transporter (DMT)-like permease